MAAAARRRGCSRMMRWCESAPRSRNQSGRYVLLPAPGGASNTTRCRCASTVDNSCSTAIIGKSRGVDEDTKAPKTRGCSAVYRRGHQFQRVNEKARYYVVKLIANQFKKSPTR